MELKFKVLIDGKYQIMDIHQIVWHYEFRNIDLYSLKLFTGMQDIHGNDIYLGDKVNQIIEDYSVCTELNLMPEINKIEHEIIFRDGQFTVAASSFGWEGEDLISLSDCELITE